MNYDNCIKNKRGGLKLETLCSTGFVNNENKVSFLCKFFFL